MKAARGTLDPASGGLFETFKKESAVNLVIHNIKNLIMSNKITPGDKLPSESELCASMSVSRGSLREAMKILSAFGIVEIRRGDGTYISKADNKIQFDPMLFSLIKANADIKKYAELRELMEGGIVRLVIKNANRDDIGRIQEEYQKMESAIGQGVRDPDILSQYDMEFHHALGHATQNILIEMIYRFVMEFFSHSVRSSHENERTGLDALRVHKKILDALVEKNLEKATAAIEESIAVWEQLIDSDPAPR